MIRLLFFSFLVLFTSSFLYGNTLDTAKTAREAVASKGVKKDGLKKSLSVSSNLILNDNRSVIGQQDGSQVTIGFNLTGDFAYIKKEHEIQFGILLTENFSRTPELERFLKTNDQLNLNTAYLYHVSSIWGPFARASLQTTLLPGYESSLEEKTYLKPDSFSVPKTTDDMKLTDSFSPLTLKQSIGAFVKPVDKKIVKVNLNLGFGAVEVFADNAYKLADNDATPNVVELEELKSYQQGGGSFLAEVSGVLDLNTEVTYKASVDILIPVIYDDDQDRGAFELTNIDFAGTLSAKLTSWLNINYQFKFLKQPQLLDEWQVQNNLSISINFNLI